MKSKGLTLIELIVTIGIATILTGVVVFMLTTSFDTYSFGQQDALLDKALDDCLEEIAGGGLESYGIKDALEILKISPTSITFVPLWIDDSHNVLTLKPNEPITLNRPVKPASSIPIAEIAGGWSGYGAKEQLWRGIPITFIPGVHRDPLKPDDLVFLNTAVDADKIRFLFHPETTNFPECAMTIKWDGTKITRTYKGKTEVIPRYNISGVKLSDLRLQYFDNTNTQLKPTPELIPNISAVRLNLEVVTSDKTNQRLSRKGFVFINVRNTRTAGRGLLIQKGMRIKIPDSKNIRAFSLANVSGIKDRGVIELEARPKKGTVWRVRILLGFEDNTCLLKRYSIEYPPGRTVYFETVNLTCDLPLNFLNLGGGRYDYDFDKNASNLVNLEGEVELVVTKMDASGANLFVRP